MKSSLFPLILAMITPAVLAHEFDASKARNLIVEIPKFVASGKMTDAVALTIMSDIIESAKKSVAAHKPMDPAKLATFLSAEQLESSTGMILISDTDGSFESLDMVRRGDLVTVSIGNQQRFRQSGFDLTKNEGPDKAFSTLYSQWQTLVRRTANAPPIAARYADRTPQQLLANAHRYNFITRTFISFK